MDVKTIGVAGAGQMGSGIAQAAAASGFSVIMGDVTRGLAEGGLGKIEKALERLAARGKITAEDRDSTLARIKPVEGTEGMDSCQIVIEAATEDEGIKLDLFRELDELTPPETVLATNTSSISITRIAAATGRPDRVVGLHFMNPAPVMPLVEVVRGLDTSQETFDAAWRLAQALGKTPVACEDSPGFVINRILVPMINEAAFALMEGVAGREDIDTVMRLGASHPLGPLALADLIGLDTCLAILEVLHRDLGDDKYRACPLIRRYVAAGRLGRKTGRGFYDYG